MQPQSQSEVTPASLKFRGNEIDTKIAREVLSVNIYFWACLSSLITYKVALVYSMRAHVLNLYPFHNCKMKFKSNLMIWQEGNVRFETENYEQLLNAQCSNRQTVIS